MSQNIFQYQPLVKQSFFQKLFRQQPEENAIIEVNNLLAGKSVMEITITDIRFIEQRHNIKLSKAFGLNLEEFYAVYLNHCLADKTLDGDELKDLQHLKSLFSLSDRTLTYLHDQIGLTVYKASFIEAVADGRITPEENEFLKRLENELKLPKELAQKISSEVRTQYLIDHVDALIDTAEYSPEDEKEIREIARSLNLDADLPNKSKQQLKQLKAYWALENLPLVEFQSDVPLQKMEICYLKIGDVSWYERRGSSAYDTYPHNVSHKAFYLQEPAKQKNMDKSALRFVDKGMVYLTNKRVIFVGQLKNSNIRLDGLKSFIPYKNALHLLKEKGKSPVLHFAKKEDVFALILERLITDLHK